MNKRSNVKFLFMLPAIILTIVLSGLTTKKDKITLFLAGDSTMSDKAVIGYPETGWGTRMREMFDSTVNVINKAHNGGSTKTFISSGLWNEIDTALKNGDFVIIQFGHNDEVPAKESYTSEIDFKKNLEFFITAVRKKKATPILLTSVARRKFDEQGKIIDTHFAYSAITTAVAKAKNVEFIDVNAQSMSLVEKMGSERSKALYNYLKPNQNPNYPAGKEDDTHLNELGARKIAQLVIAALKKDKTELSKRIIIGNQGIK